MTLQEDLRLQLTRDPHVAFTVLYQAMLTKLAGFNLQVIPLALVLTKAQYLN
jgi:hypothetical protein